jgi:hypothetical protein
VAGGSLVEARAVESVVVVLLREAASVPFCFAVLLWERRGLLKSLVGVFPQEHL